MIDTNQIIALYLIVAIKLAIVYLAFRAIIWTVGIAIDEKLLDKSEWTSWKRYFGKRTENDE